MSTTPIESKTPSRLERGYDSYYEIHDVLKRLVLRDCWKSGWDPPNVIREDLQSSVDWPWRDPDLDRHYFEGVSITIR